MAKYDFPQLNFTLPDISKMSYYDMANYVKGNRSMYQRRDANGNILFGYKDFNTGTITAYPQQDSNKPVALKSKPLRRIARDLQPIKLDEELDGDARHSGANPIKLPTSGLKERVTDDSTSVDETSQSKVSHSYSISTESNSAPVDRGSNGREEVVLSTGNVSKDDASKPVVAEPSKARLHAPMSARAAAKRGVYRTSPFERAGIFFSNLGKQAGHFFSNLFKRRDPEETYTPTRAELRRLGITNLPSTGGTKWDDYVEGKSATRRINHSDYLRDYNAAKELYENDHPTEPYDILVELVDVPDISAEIDRLIQLNNLPLDTQLDGYSVDEEPITPVQKPVVEPVLNEYKYLNVHDNRGIYSSGTENNRAFSLNLYHGYLGAFKDYIQDPELLKRFAGWATMLSAGETSYGRTPRTAYNYGNLNYNTNFKNLLDYLNAFVTNFNKYHKSAYNATSLEDFVHRLKLSNYYEAPENRYKRLLLGVRDKVLSYIGE